MNSNSYIIYLECRYPVRCSLTLLYLLSTPFFHKWMKNFRKLKKDGKLGGDLYDFFDMGLGVVLTGSGIVGAAISDSCNCQ